MTFSQVAHYFRNVSFVSHAGVKCKVALRTYVAVTVLFGTILVTMFLMIFWTQFMNVLLLTDRHTHPHE